jgi:hypothetical protein
MYLAYAVLSMHWLPFAILGGWVFGSFLRITLAKDAHRLVTNNSRLTNSALDRCFLHN